MSADRKVREALEVLRGINGGMQLASEMLGTLAKTTNAAASARDAFLRRGVKEPRARKVTAPDPRGPLYELGELTEVGYAALKGKDRLEAEYIHRFEAPMPRLAATLDGGLVIVGGGYRITPAGIVG